MSIFLSISGDDVSSTRCSNVEWSISLVGEELFSMILNDDGLVDEIVSTSLNDEESVDGIVSTFLKDEESVDGFVDEIVSTFRNSEFSFSASVDSGAVMVELK